MLKSLRKRCLQPAQENYVLFLYELSSNPEDLANMLNDNTTWMETLSSNLEEGFPGFQVMLRCTGVHVLSSLGGYDYTYKLTEPILCFYVSHKLILTGLSPHHIFLLHNVSVKHFSMVKFARNFTFHNQHVRVHYSRCQKSFNFGFVIIYLNHLKTMTDKSTHIHHKEQEKDTQNSPRTEDHC